MTRESYRRIAALTGLSLGTIMMWALGYWGLVPMALFGGVSCVIGAITGERLHDRRYKNTKR